MRDAPKVVLIITMIFFEEPLPPPYVPLDLDLFFCPWCRRASSLCLPCSHNKITCAPTRVFCAGGDADGAALQDIEGDSDDDIPELEEQVGGDDSAEVSSGDASDAGGGGGGGNSRDI